MKNKLLVLFTLLGSGNICYSLLSRLANYTPGPKDKSQDTTSSQGRRE